MSGEAFGAEFGVSKGAVGQWEAKDEEKRTQPDLDKVIAIARRYRLSIDWLADGRGAPPPWLNSQHPSGGTDSSGPVAQDMSLDPNNVPPSAVVWEVLMKMKVVPEQFAVAMPDEALAPNISKGTLLYFARLEQWRPNIEDGVLVEDQNGNRCIRRYGEGLGGGWLAQAINPAYMTLESGQHGLKVLAVMTGRGGSKV